MREKYKVPLSDVLKIKKEDIHSMNDFIAVFDSDGAPATRLLYESFKKAFVALRKDDYNDETECFEEADDLIDQLRKSRRTTGFWDIYCQYVEIDFGENGAVPEPEPVPVPPDPIPTPPDPVPTPPAPVPTPPDPVPTPPVIDFSDEDFHVTLEKANQYFLLHSNTIQHVNHIKIKIERQQLFEDQDITLHNGISIDTGTKISVSRHLALITDFEMNQVLVAGKLTEQKNDNGVTCFFTAEKNLIFPDGFRRRAKFMLILLDSSFSGFNSECPMYAQQINLMMKPLPTTDQYLCIDFGTSNTSAGTYGIKDTSNKRTPELVDFINCYDNSLSKICPTVVYVNHCEDEDNIELLFGFEAQQKIREMDYVTEATAIFELKKWVSDSDSDEVEVRDENGWTATVKKSEIVRQYLEYVIHQAESYFGCRFQKLHFTAPVKMKDKFIAFMRKLFRDKYEIPNSDECVDEAVAVIFDYITKEDFSNTLSKDIFDKKIVVLDCGGGTTDLAMCEYHSQRDDNKYRRVLVHTRSENGNNRFGGNNITYKIMQLIKIKICQNFAEGELAEKLVSLKDVFRDEADILKEIDNQLETAVSDRHAIVDEIYKAFNELYQACEELIPTKFEGSIADNDKVNIKRNFYFLWQFAEQIKMEFYREDKVIVDKRTYLDLKSLARSSHLYAYKDGELEKINHPMDDIEISITEIQKLICGDIYMLLCELLPSNADEMDYYFLSGQSCKIKLFNDLLKEFVAGKKLRTKMYEGDQQTKDLELKLKCIKGSINYIATNASGISGMVQIRTDRPAQIYTVLYQEQLAGKDENAFYGLKPLTDVQTELDLYIRNLNDNSLQETKRIKIPPIDMTTDYTCAELMNRDGGIYFGNNRKLELAFQERISKKLGNGERYSLVLPSKDGYGYYVVFLQYEDGKYYLSEDIHMSFEEGMHSFFDGSK